MQVRDLAEKYFGGWRQEVLPAAAPSAVEALPRPSQGPVELQQAAKAGPAFMQAFYRPGVAHPDAPVHDIIRCVHQGQVYGHQSWQSCFLCTAVCVKAVCA